MKTVIKVENNLLWVPLDPASAVRGQKIEHLRHSFLFSFSVNQSRAKIKYNLTSEVKDYSENETSIYKSWQLGSLCVYTRNDVCIYYMYTHTGKCWLANKAYHCHACTHHSREIILYTLSSLFFKYTFVCEQDFKNGETECINFYVCAPPRKATIYQTTFLLSYIYITSSC